MNSITCALLDTDKSFIKLYAIITFVPFLI